MKFLSNKKHTMQPVNIDTNLCNEVATIVNADSNQYPDIKSFIEKAVRYRLNRIKYNIENFDDVVTSDGNLIGKSDKGFTRCPVCDHLFLNKKERMKNGKYICPRCSEIIKFYARRL